MKAKAVMFASILLTVATFTFGQTDGAANSPAVSVAASSSTAPRDNEAPLPVQPVVAGPRRYGAVSFRRDGLWFSTEDGSTHLQVHGYIQADNRWFLENTHGEPVDAFLFRKIRPLFEGTLFNHVDFRFMPDFGQNNPQIQEAYLEWKTLP